MLSLAMAVSAALQVAPVTGDLAGANRDAVGEALVRGQIAVDRIGHCTEELPERVDLEADYQSLSSQLRAAVAAAEEVYGGIDPLPESISRTAGSPLPRCTAAVLRTLVGDARRSTTEAVGGVRADTAPRAHGLWLGNLHLCGGRIVAVEDGEPFYPGGPPGLVLRFSEEFAPRVHALTARLVRKPLSIVLDGRTIASPVVMEPLRTAMSTARPEGLPLDSFRAAIATAC